MEALPSLVLPPTTLTTVTTVAPFVLVLQAEIEADVAARDAAFKTSLVGKLQVRLSPPYDPYLGPLSILI